MQGMLRRRQINSTPSGLTRSGSPVVCVFAAISKHTQAWGVLSGTKEHCSKGRGRVQTENPPPVPTAQGFLSRSPPGLFSHGSLRETLGRPRRPPCAWGALRAGGAHLSAGVRALPSWGRFPSAPH